MESPESSDYHVFLTGYDQGHVLHVMSRTTEGFTVEADATLATLKGHAQDAITGSFSWRVVAKRKDIPGERLATVHVPAAPTLPELPAPHGPVPTEDLQRVRHN